MSGKRPVQPQPPKMPKQHNTRSTTQAQTSGPLVPLTNSQRTQPVSSSSVANRYLVSTIPKPNYQRPQGQHSYSSALATIPSKATSPYTVEEPFDSIVPKQSSSTLPPRTGRASYIKKPFVQHVSYIEPHLAHITDPLALAMEVLPHEWHFLPKSPEKGIRFYKGILYQEKSARIEDIPDKSNPSRVLYHKFIIQNFVSCKDWGHPSSLRPLTLFKGSEPLYNYYDYMDAFEKVLFFQNKTQDHSWFIQFDKNFNSQIPSWFLKWWEMFGSVPQNLPEPLQDALRYFSSKFQTDKHTSQFPAILHMSLQYKIHWISMWSYVINQNLLDREFFTKWWDRFRPTDVISKLYKDFPLPIQKSIAHCTRSQSSLDSVQISGKSSKELRDLAQQLLLQSEQLESEEKNSPASSEASCNLAPVSPFQDAQDPYDGYNLDSDYEP